VTGTSIVIIRSSLVHIVLYGFVWFSAYWGFARHDPQSRGPVVRVGQVVAVVVDDGQRRDDGRQGRGGHTAGEGLRDQRVRWQVLLGRLLYRFVRGGIQKARQPGAPKIHTI